MYDAYLLVPLLASDQTLHAHGGMSPPLSTAQMTDALKSGKTPKTEKFMQGIARDHGLTDAEAAYHQLAEAEEFHREQLRSVKDASSKQGEGGC